MFFSPNITRRGGAVYNFENLGVLALLCLGALILAPFYRAAVYFIKRVTAPVRAERRAWKRYRGRH